MIDFKQLLSDPEGAARRLGRKGVSEEETARAARLFLERNRLLKETESLRARQNAFSRETGRLRAGADGAEDGGIEARKQKAALLKGRRLKSEAALQAAERACRQALLNLPNFPDDKAPEGKTEAESPVIKQGFRPEELSKKSPPHWEIAEELGILDQKRASKISGPLFAVLRGDGAKLLRALLSLAFQMFEDYTELIVPSLVGSEAFTGTGHLPKFAEDAYHIEKDDLWLIPTGEVPLTALHGGEILNKSLPLKYMTCTSCFRREAGAAGERTRGLQRLHEFHKLELVKICRPEDSQKELDLLLEDALKPVKTLKLPWRVRDLCAGDLTFASARTYDIEVFSPGTGRWLEVSSVGLFTDYQARRCRIRFRDREQNREKGGALRFPHTLNGSGLAVPRIYAALLECGLQEDGRVLVPEALQDFMSCKYIEKQ